MAKGFDCYGAVPVDLLDNYDFILRYVCLQPGKCVTPEEIASYRAASKAVALFYEDEADDGLGGANAGAAKASIAKPILASIGWPADLPVHFAFDMPGYSYDLPTFLACAQAFAAGINRPVAAYGDVDTCTYLYEHGVRYLIQFGEGRAPGITVYQSSPVQLDGYDIDPDTALVSNYGQWSPNPPEALMDMHTVKIVAGANGEGSHTSSYPFTKVGSIIVMEGVGPNHILCGIEEASNGNAILSVKGAAAGQTVSLRVGVLS